MVAGAKDVLTTDDQSSACRMRWQNAQSSPIWPAVGRSRSVATLYERNLSSAEAKDSKGPSKAVENQGEDPRGTSDATVLERSRKKPVRS
jgi:hypothetical protein